jgi:hypothetical protein
VEHFKKDASGGRTLWIPENSSGSSEGGKPNITYILGLLTGVAGLGSVIYILGIFSVWVPIVRTYEQDFVAAWHATSLIPKTVVIGLGAQHLIAVPLIIVAGMVLIAVMVEYLFLGRLRALQWKSLVQPRRRIPLPASVQKEKVDKWLAEREPRIYLWALISVDSFLAWGLIGIYVGWRINAHLPDTLQVPGWGMGGATLLTMVGIYAVVSAFASTKSSDSSGDTHKIAGEITRGRYARRYLESAVVGAPLYLLATFFLIFLSWYSATRTKPWHPASSTKPQADQVLTFLHHLFKAFDAEALVYIAVITLAGVSVLAVNTVILGEFVREGGYPKHSHAPRLIIVVVWAFIAAFAFTLINQPPLPRVEVHGSTTVESGRLLAHADGFWYVYNAADDLIAIRDDNVKTVKYKSEP